MEDVLKTAITDALEELGFGEVAFTLEHPENLAFGDYACNVAMVAFTGRRTFEAALDADSKTVNVRHGIDITSPRQLAEKIKEKLDGQIEYVEKIEIAGPGFLNFTLSRDFFVGEVVRATSLEEQWGANTSQQGEVVLVEYTSPNLFKPLHIGNLVGNIIGESVARLFSFSGAKVVRCNYPSDIGLTVAKGVWGLQKYNLDPHDILALGEAYKKGSDAYEEDGEAKSEIVAINQALYAGIDEKLMALRNAGIATSKARLSELCRLLGTEFDVEILESEASIPGLEIVKANVGGVFEVSEGAVVYKGEKVGLHTRVFINSKGLPTYEAKDIGHFKLKSSTNQNWTQSIIVTGNEQSEYFKVVFSAIAELFPEVGTKSLEHIPTGFLTLTTGKMSSRKGNVLTGESLLEEMQEEAKVRASNTDPDSRGSLAESVAVGALKYQILRHGVGSNIVFDKEQALSFEGASGPYLQYTHARICSTLAKAESVGVVPGVLKVPELPYALERIVCRFPEVVEHALEERAPHFVATYLTELASVFNTFYGAEKIADPADEFAPYKALLAKSVAQTLKNGLWVLGIKAPVQM